MQQHTISRRVSCSGVALHSGSRVTLWLQPAAAGSGIRFVRTDLGPGVEIPVRPASLGAARRATRLAAGGASVATVEHLLAAALALGIDNLHVEVDGPELPDLDGCALGFCELLRSAGSVSQAAPRRPLRLDRTIELGDARRWIRAEPGRGLALAYAIDFAHPAIGRQELCLGPLDAELFQRELAPARSFGFLSELPELGAEGLARGGSLERVLVLDAERVLNPGGLRFPDEFVRHKLLDLVGDLALLGRPLEACVRVSRGGHALHHALVAELAAKGPQP